METTKTEMDFDEIVSTLSSKSNKAKATFMHQMIKRLGPQMCRAVIRYACMQLDSINSSYPDGHPLKNRYELYQTRRKQRIEQQLQ